MERVERMTMNGWRRISGEVCELSYQIIGVKSAQAPQPSQNTMSEIPDISDSPSTSAAALVSEVGKLRLDDKLEEEIPDIDDIPDMDEAEGLEEGDDDAAVRIVHPSTYVEV